MSSEKPWQEVLNKNKFLLSLVLITFFYGIYNVLIIGKSWDTFFFIETGKSRLAYLLSLGTVPLKENQVSELYPGVYSIINSFFLQIFPNKYELEIFHLLNFFVSFLGAVGLYKLTKKIFNKEVGIITFFIFILNPIFFGHMGINDRDTVMLTANLWLTFYVMKYLDFDKQKNKKYIIYIALFLALGLGVRFAFLATLIPVFFYGIFIIYKKKLLSNIKTVLFDILKIILISSAIVIFFWAPIHELLFTNPLDLFKKLFAYPWGVPFVLLNGEVHQSGNVPFYYIFVSLFFKTPEYILFLSLLYLLIFKKILNYFSKNISFFLTKQIFVMANIILPSFLLLLSPFSVYDGLRLFLFILPYLSIIPAITLLFIFKNLKLNFYKFIFSTFAILLVYFGLKFLFITPYHYTYLNFFINKKDASKKFENDYWGTSLKELLNEKNLTNLGSEQYIKFSTCGVSNGSVKYYLKQTNLMFNIVRPEENPDYVILTNRVNNNYKKNSKEKTCFDLYKGSSIVKVERDSLLLSAIKKID